MMVLAMELLVSISLYFLRLSQGLLNSNKMLFMVIMIIVVLLCLFTSLAYGVCNLVW